MTENPPRLVRGEAGLVSTGGLTSQVEWTHRSFLGGARTFTVAATAQTGLVALETPAERRYRLARVRVPALCGHRDTLRGRWARSWSTATTCGTARRRSGFEGTLVYATEPAALASPSATTSRIARSSTTASATTSSRSTTCRCSDSRTRPRSDRWARIINRSALTLDGSWGKLDEFANPRQGYVLRPRVSVTLPGFNTSEYSCSTWGRPRFMPLTDRIGFTVRGSAGRIFPFGRSVATGRAASRRSSPCSVCAT